MLTAAGTAFWWTVAITVGVMAKVSGSDPSPGDLARVAFPLGLPAAAVAAVFSVAVMVMG